MLFQNPALSYHFSPMWKILSKDFCLRAYAIQLVEELKPSEHRLRYIFDDYAHSKLAEDNNFYQGIVFRGEVHSS